MIIKEIEQTALNLAKGMGHVFKGSGLLKTGESALGERRRKCERCGADVRLEPQALGAGLSINNKTVFQNPSVGVMKGDKIMISGSALSKYCK